MLIHAFNPTVDELERTFLSQSYTIGVSVVEAKSNQRFTNGDRLLIGEMGLSQSEIVTAGNPNSNGTTLPITATLYSHPANTPIYQLQFDQVKYYRSTNGINGTYTLLTTVNIDVTSADLQTSYSDNSAQTGYYYKVSMFNSVSLLESAQSDPIAGITGWDLNQVGNLIDQIYQEIADPEEQLLSRDELIGYFNDVNDDLKTNVAKPYRFLYTRSVLDRTINKNYINLPTDPTTGAQLVWKFDRLDYRFLDNTTTPVTDTTGTIQLADLEYFRNRYQNNVIDSTTVDDTIQLAALNDALNTIDYYPASKTTSTYGCFYLYYWQDFARITTEAQYFQTYSPHIYKLYALMKFYRKRSITEPAYLQLATIYTGDYRAELQRYKSHDRRDAGSSRRFRSENTISRRYQR